MYNLLFCPQVERELEISDLIRPMLLIIKPSRTDEPEPPSRLEEAKPPRLQ